MGNFEKLSVLVIGVIIVMILVVALYTWTDDPAGGPGDPTSTTARLNAVDTVPPAKGAGEPEPYLWETWNTPPPPKDVPNELAKGAPAKAPSVAAPVGGAPTIEPGRVAAPAPLQERKVVVQDGDTLGHISQRVYGTVKHWPKIAERNNVRPESLRAGMELIIPAIDSAGGGSTAAPASASTSGTTAAGSARPQVGSKYKVRAGDTIEKIAKAAYGTVERWPDIWLENMERIENPNDLPAGIEIEIP